MKIIMFGASKGGTGKTTMCFNIATEYAKRNPNKKVAIIDTDKQANTTSFFGYGPLTFKGRDFSSYLLSQVNSKDIMTRSDIHENLYLLPASRVHRIHQKSIEGSDIQNKYYLFKNALVKDEFLNDFDVLFVDTHPGTDIFSGNILMVADAVIHVVKAGCRHSLDSLETYKEDFELDISLNELEVPDVKWYCLINQFKNNLASKDFVNHLQGRDDLDQEILDVCVRESTALMECAINEKSVIDLQLNKKTKNSIEDIKSLVNELEAKGIL